MTGWFRETPESLRLLSEESALLEAAEVVTAALEARKETKKSLAARLNIARSEVTQRLSGKRNLTIRSLAAMLHELDFDLQLRIRDRSAPVTAWRDCTTTAAGMRYASDGNQIRLVKPAA